MANEIQHAYHTTGETLYAIIVQPSTGKVRDVVAGAWDTLADADWGDYDVPMTEAGTASKLYQADAPSDLLTAGYLEYIVYVQAGGSPAVTDEAVAKGSFGDDVYFAQISVTIDDTSGRDEYQVAWYRNGIPITSGITLPKIQVVKRADGTELVAETAMTQVGSTSAYKYDESSNRLTAGEAAVVVATATIGGAVRTCERAVSRDV